MFTSFGEDPMTMVGIIAPPTPLGEPSLAAEQIVQSLSHELMSPYCPGRTISSCPSPNARKLEDFILEEATKGKSKEQIEQGLVATFGREKLGSLTSPAVLGFAGGVGLVAALVIAVLSRRWRSRPGQREDEARVRNAVGGPAASRARGPSDDELDRLSDALDEIEEF